MKHLTKKIVSLLLFVTLLAGIAIQPVSAATSGITDNSDTTSRVEADTAKQSSETKKIPERAGDSGLQVGSQPDTTLVGTPTYEYKSDTFGNVTITKYTGIMPSESIPSTLSGGTVTVIDDDAFRGCTTIKSVIIPDTVTNIGDYVFCNCTSLESVTIPNSVTTIGSHVFSGCTSLTSVQLPDSLTNTNDCLFYKCTSLESVTLPKSLRTIGGDTFYDCSSLTRVKIPDSVTNIGSCAFVGCTTLKNLTIPNTVTSIGYYAFNSCPSLTLGVYNGSYAEKYAKENSVPYIVYNDAADFKYTTASDGNVTITGYDGSDVDVNIPPEINGGTVVSIGESAFQENTSINSVIIPDSITSIGNGAFYNCASLASVTIPDSITSIGSYTFDHCTSLASVTLPDSVTSIGDSVFLGCTSLASITIPDSVTSIGSETFYNCTSLISVTIPNSVTHIGSSAFYNCTSLENVIIPDAITRIGYEMFYNCKSLKSVTIPDSVTSIDYQSFVNCTSLESVTIPKSVTSIRNNAFNECPSLTLGVYRNSYAASYVIENNIPYVYIDNDDNTDSDSISGTFYFRCDGENTKISDSILFYIWDTENSKNASKDGWVNDNVWGSNKIKGTPVEGSTDLVQSYELSIPEGHTLMLIIHDPNTGYQSANYSFTSDIFGKTLTSSNGQLVIYNGEAQTDSDTETDTSSDNYHVETAETASRETDSEKSTDTSSDNYHFETADTASRETDSEKSTDTSSDNYHFETGDTPDTESDFDTDGDNDSDTDTSTDTDSDTDTDTSTDTDSDTDTDTSTDTDSDTETDTSTDTDSDTETDTSTDTDSDTETDTSTDTDSDTETDTSTDTDSDTEIDTSTDTESDTETDTSTDTESDTETDTDSDEPVKMIQKEYSGLVPGSKYVFAIVRDKNAANPLSTDNCLYTAQYTADDNGNVIAEYPENIENGDFMLTLEGQSVAYFLKGWLWNGNTSAEAVFARVDDPEKTTSVNAEIDIQRTEPTCEEDGKAVYVANVEFDGVVYFDNRTEILNKTGHDYALDHWNWRGNKTAFAVFVCKHDPSHEKYIMAKISSDRIEPTETTAGKVDYHAEAELEGYIYSDDKTETLSAIGYNYVFKRWLWSGYENATAVFAISNNSENTIDIEAMVSEKTDPATGTTTYTATVFLDGVEYTDVKVKENKDDKDNNEPSDKIQGDLDGDSNITSNDAVLILSASVGIIKLTDEEFKLSDVDGDGAITSNDALTVLILSVRRRRDHIK